MRLLALAAIFIVSGCASLTPEKARLMSNLELCEAVYTKSTASASVANQEILARGERCSAYLPIIRQRQREFDRAMEGLREAGDTLRRVGKETGW
jgi:hypothetical protein